MSERNNSRKTFLPVILSSIVGRIRERRRAKGFTQSEAADRLGVAQSYIAKMEAGTSDFPISRLVEFARILDLELVLVPKEKLAVVDALLKEQDRSSPNIKELFGIEDIEQ